jgi:serine/threonine protein kinase
MPVCHIVQDVFEDDSNIHMVMELCTGGSILEHLKGGKPLSEAIVADISRCILRFIAQCHTKCVYLQSETEAFGCNTECYLTAVLDAQAVSSTAHVEIMCIDAGASSIAM